MIPPTPPSASEPSETRSDTPPTTLACERCGQFDAREIAGLRLCDDCYFEAGACCAPGTPSDR